MEDDRQPIHPPSEPSEDETTPMSGLTGGGAAAGATIKSKPPRWSPPPKFARQAVIISSIALGIPVILWGPALAMSRPPSPAANPWFCAALTESAGNVVLRPADWASAGGAVGGGGAEASSPASSAAPAVIVVERRGEHLVGREAGASGRVLWEFPKGKSETLAGNTLAQSVLWIPRTGPYAPEDPKFPGAVIVFWRPQSESGASKDLFMTLLDSGGKEQWSQSLEPGSQPGQVQWILRGTRSLLAWQNQEGMMRLYDPGTGKTLKK